MGSHHLRPHNSDGGETGPLRQVDDGIWWAGLGSCDLRPHNSDGGETGTFRHTDDCTSGGSSWDLTTSAPTIATMAFCGPAWDLMTSAPTTATGAKPSRFATLTMAQVVGRLGSHHLRPRNSDGGETGPLRQVDDGTSDGPAWDLTTSAPTTATGAKPGRFATLTIAQVVGRLGILRPPPPQQRRGRNRAALPH